MREYGEPTFIRQPKFDHLRSLAPEIPDRGRHLLSLCHESFSFEDTEYCL
jgi:hypothetical protein